MSKAEKENIELINYSKVDLDKGIVKTTEETLDNNKDIVAQQLENQLSLYSTDEAQIKKAVKDNQSITTMVENVLVENRHYGFIPGTKSKTLFQAGADILARTYGIEIRYELQDKIIDLTNNLIDYEYKAVAHWTGKRIGEADASANSLEQKFKTHFWDKTKDEMKKGKSAYDIKNTIQQMAQKRAMVRVISKILGLKGAFTQDIEDIMITATRNDKWAVYVPLYMYMTDDMGKNKTTRQNYLKLNVLKPVVDLVAEGRGFTKWTTDDCDNIINKLNDKDFVMELLNKAKGSE